MTEATHFNELLFIIYSFGCSFAFISILAICICGCKKGTPKNELLGLDGLVKITNPDENVNHLPAVGNYVFQSAGDASVSEFDEVTKRPSGGSNPHRSLPDIPVLAEGEVRINDNGVSGDTSSELYATVDDKTISVYKRHTVPNGIDIGPSLSHQSSLSQSDSNYARLKENPYDKVLKSENPYANLKSTDSKETEGSSQEASPQANRKSVICHVNPIESSSSEKILERPHRASGQCSQNTNGNPSSTSDIPAATAVAGRVAASQDLPYMTPPISQPQHFSGDSQDSSSRGYTSISVREPLANIINHVSSVRNRRNDIDPHYSTVSDDSDEMYAAIVEPNSNIYNGSETYAQIEPVTVAEIHNPAENSEVDGDDQYEPAPQPPSVDSLKHVAHVHSRQASSSSCTSSVANLGSPKPEKRQANSPLPLPPATVSPDLYNRIDENHLAVVRNLEDMYAKVHKNKKKHDESSSSNEFDLLKLSHGRSSRDSFEDLKHLDSLSSIESEKNSSKRSTIEEHCYETLNKDKKSQSPRKSESSNSNVWQNNDPGYEELNPQNCASSESDPNYEVLRPHQSAYADENSAGYSTVPEQPNKHDQLKKANKSKAEAGYEEVQNQIDEPNYESMPSECTDDNYATINQKSTESESDPNYESVKYLDVTLSEPPYERLNDDETKGSSDLSEYEQVSSNNHHQDLSAPGYERIKCSSDNSEDRSDSTDFNSTDPPAALSVNLDLYSSDIQITIPNPNVVKDVQETDIFHV